jgi:hypothetical protein
MMSTCCSKHVEAWNKYIKKERVRLVINQNYVKMHGQQNIKVNINLYIVTRNSEILNNHNSMLLHDDSLCIRDNVPSAFLANLCYSRHQVSQQITSIILKNISFTSCFIHICELLQRSRYSTRYGLDGPGIGCRWTARFFAPVKTGPGAHPSS